MVLFHAIANLHERVHRELQLVIHILVILKCTLYYQSISLVLLTYASRVASRSYEVVEPSRESAVRSSELALQVLVACVELLTIPPPMTGAESQNASHAGSAAVSQIAPEQHTRALLSTLSSRYSMY